MKHFDPKKPYEKNNHKKREYSDGPVPVKKKHLGQHFLRKQSVVDHMIDKVSVSDQTSVLEIGCGDGFLTRSILEQTKCKQLWCYEIDSEWADFVKKSIRDPRLSIKLQNVLEADFSELEAHKPWVILANLPYQITFPIMFLLQKNKNLFQEGVVMVQEEVAQKIVAKHGKKYNPTSMFLQYHFEWETLEKIEPQAFTPPPKVFSRLLYFRPKETVVPIVQEDQFWSFLKLCFRFPRQTLKNNLKSTHFPYHNLSEEILGLRSQQLSLNDFLSIWQTLSGV